MLRLVIAALLPAAAPQDVELGWEAPSACPSHAAVEARARTLLGQHAVLPMFGGVITRHADGYRLALRIESQAGAETREHEDPSCDALGEAAALAVTAVAFREAEVASRPSGAEVAERPSGAEIASRPSGADFASRPSRAEVAERPSGAEIASRPSGAEVAEQARVSSDGPESAATESSTEAARAGSEAGTDVRSSDRRRPPRTSPPRPKLRSFEADTVVVRQKAAQKRLSLMTGTMRASAGADIGSFTAGLVGVAAGLQWRRARLELEGSYATPRRKLFRSEQGVVLSSGGVAARACYLFNVRPSLAVPLCGSITAGVLRAQPWGLSDARVRHPLWLALGVAPQIVWRFHRHAAIFASVDVYAHLLRPAVDVTLLDGERATLHRPSLFGVRPTAGLSIFFGGPR